MGATKRKVLVIDDHLPTKTLLAQALNVERYDLIGDGTDGKNALELVKILSPDVLLMAVGLPGIDGITVARRIMEESPIAILLITSHYARITVERAKTAGIMAYLFKPLRKEELVPNIELAVCRFAEMMSLRRDNEHLRKTLESRKAIERAKGILMRNQGLAEDEAFRSMQKKSMNTHRPMVEIARAIILSDEITRK